MTNKHFSADAPVSSKAQDKFSRWKFAERVAQVIAKREDSSGLVIGLHGVWGDGKTSVLNFIQESLESEEKVICIKFNPWRYGTEDDLLKGFFFTIAEALDTKLIRKGDSFKDLVKKLAPHAGEAINLGWLGNIVSHFIKKIDTDELKKRIEATLEKTQKRVLILIDDVDRLDKAEIQLLFKIVKLIADFKYTAYILAFDKDIVASALQDRYAGANHNAGEAFLEKIIQIPLHLPAVSKEVLQQICYDDINNALSVAEIELTEQQVQDFLYYYFSVFDEQLCTPRRAKLYGNALLFSLPILKGEVNPIDLMLIEGVRIFYPSLYETIRNHKIFFTKTLKNYETETAKKKIGDIINPALDVPHINKEKIINLLMKLFPNNHNEIFEYSRQRICSPDYFSKYFLYSVPNGEVADSAISSFLSNLASWQYPFNEAENPFNGLLDINNADIIIRKLQNKANSIPSGIIYPLVIAIAQKNRLMVNPNKILSFSALVQSIDLTSYLIQNVKRAQSVELFSSCIDFASSLEYKVKLFHLLSSEDRERPENKYFPDEYINQFGTYLGKNIIEEHISHNEDIIISYSSILFDIFNILHNYVNDHCVNDYVMPLIDQDPMAIGRLLTIYTPNSYWGIIDSIENSRKKYDSLAEKLDMSAFIKKIEENFPYLCDISDGFTNKNGQKNLSLEELAIQECLRFYHYSEKYSSME
jgi:hypothetical protein